MAVRANELMILTSVFRGWSWKSLDSSVGMMMISTCIMRSFPYEMISFIILLCTYFCHFSFSFRSSNFYFFPRSTIIRELIKMPMTQLQSNIVHLYDPSIFLFRKLIYFLATSQSLNRFNEVNFQRASGHYRVTSSYSIRFRKGFKFKDMVWFCNGVWCSFHPKVLNYHSFLNWRFLWDQVES